MDSLDSGQSDAWCQFVDPECKLRPEFNGDVEHFYRPPPHMPPPAAPPSVPLPPTPPSPSPSPENEWFRVTSGFEYCELSGACVTDGAGDYGHNENCTVEALRDLYLTATECVVSHYDELKIGNQSYSDCNYLHPQDWPKNVLMPEGSTLTWQTNVGGTIVHPGFTVCASAEPTRPPSRRRKLQTSQSASASPQPHPPSMPPSAPATYIDPLTGQAVQPPTEGGEDASKFVSALLRDLLMAAAGAASCAALGGLCYFLRRRRLAERRALLAEHGSNERSKEAPSGIQVEPPTRGLTTPGHVETVKEPDLPDEPEAAGHDAGDASIVQKA